MLIHRQSTDAAPDSATGCQIKGVSASGTGKRYIRCPGNLCDKNGIRSIKENEINTVSGCACLNVHKCRPIVSGFKPGQWKLVCRFAGVVSIRNIPNFAG